MRFTYQKRKRRLYRDEHWITAWPTPNQGTGIWVNKVTPAELVAWINEQLAKETHD